MRVIYRTALLTVWYAMVCVYGQRDRKPATDLTIDQIILKTMGDNQMAANLVQIPGGKKLAELDMMLTPEQFAAFYPDTTKKRKKRKAVRNTVFRWPNAVMKYAFRDGVFSNLDKYMIKVSMREWEKYTCVRFEEREPSDTDYVLFNDGFGCNSQLGMVRGEQLLNLDANGCRWKGLYLHEIGHALGLIHEHQRPIRDGFIRILSQNVEPSMRRWFEKYPAGTVNPYNVSYEYSSVMHYGITAFSSDGKKQTIQATQSDRESEIGRVYLKELSFTDIEVVSNMYNCNDHCDKVSKVCVNGGFLDQNCECLCPDGTYNCEQGNVQPGDPSCVNIASDWQCNIWATQAECSNNAPFMNDKCRKACGVCGRPTSSADDRGECVDFYDDAACRKWKDNGDCIVNEEWMRRSCNYTCGLCDRNASPPGTSCENRHNSDSQCEEWARKGECQINPAWMPDNCQKACRTCPITGSTTRRPRVTTRRPQVTTTRSRVSTRRPVTTTRRPIRTTTPYTTPTTTAIPRADCLNRWPDSSCDAWAKGGHCQINPTFMEVNCMLSCDECPQKKETTSNTGDTDTTGVMTTTGNSECKNSPDWDKYCGDWANHDHCSLNPGWMKVFCMKSCRSCSSSLRQLAKRQAMAEGVINEDGSIKNGTNPFGEMPLTPLNSAATERSIFGLLLTMAICALMGH
ncbi:zinc metalloproteinase nas-14-like [Mizuhopecten yessoensis]|uniref:Metalloendopeptidase n=1 Tax=Mizuhopecten yessoensis TaxID=6573 RepID=A0A210QLP4_MIZYE|nr:zinc metalloproteinase nas-14-like [Mizuhopecten yessoensis]OWF49657.1 Blastula protease 10 [Mizuhopecten yessoensis]